MIELALDDLDRGGGRLPSTLRGRRAADARAWIFTRPDAFFPFDSACAIVELDPAAVREAIARQEASAPPTPSLDEMLARRRGGSD